MKRLVSALAITALVLAVPALVAAAENTFTAALTGSHEVPPVSTTASGNATVTISADGSTVRYKVTYSGLSGDLAAAHIHIGAVGANGGVALPLKVGPSPFSGTLTSADFKAVGDVTTFAGALTAIRAGNAYVNLHTAANQGGEIRGQLTGQPNTDTERL